MCKERRRVSVLLRLHFCYEMQLERVVLIVTLAVLFFLTVVGNTWLCSSTPTLPTTQSLATSHASGTTEASTVHTTKVQEPVSFEWCQPTRLPAYTAPHGTNDTAFRVQLPRGSGACSQLMGILYGVMYATAQKRAFFIDERISRLPGNHSSWFTRFFQPIGDQNRDMDAPPLEDVYFSVNSKVHNFASGSPVISIGSEKLPRVQMKRRFTRRIWQFQPWVREKICPMLGKLNLRHPYVSLLVRRGDKILENRAPIPLNIITEFLSTVTWNGLFTRQVFVGTDDCRSINELAKAAPEYSFTSLCHLHFGQGWSLNQTQSDLTEHFLKFFGELTAMAAADVFLGDAGSNVHHWVSFMRSETSGNFTVYNMRDRKSVV